MSQPQNKLSGLSSAKMAVLRDILRKKRPAEGATDRIEPREDRLAPLPLSFSQLRLWFLDRLHPGDPIYNLPSATRILGTLHLPSLALALAGVADRHEALRTTFAATEDGEPVQVIAPRFVPRLPVVDLGALPAARRNPEIRRMSALESRLPFDLEKGPLLRGCVFRCTDDEHLLLLAMHHIVSDGWSMGVLVNEIGALYLAFLAGQPSPLPELPVQYPDFAVWQRRRLSGARLEAELDWWRSRLGGMSPVLELPADHPRQAVRSTRGAVRTFLMDPAALSELQALSRLHEATLFMTLLAGFFVVLQRYTGEDDLAVATPIAGRIRAELGPLIGFFVNTLVLRTDLGGNPSFSDLLTQVRETTLSSYSHQELPFERLVEELAPERDLSRPPLVQVMFAMENIPEDALKHPGIEIIPEGTGLGIVAKFELACTFREIEEGLLGMLDYSRELFEAPTMVRLGGHFERLLFGVLAEPQRPLAEIPLLAPGERHQLLAEWNDTAVGYPRGHTLHQLVAAQADRTPGAVAAVDENEQVTYRELVDRARQLAGRLARLGVKPDGRVGVLLERSLAMITALLGVLEAGAAYVPLDPTLPEERLATLAENAGLSAVVTQDRFAALLPAEGAPVVRLDTSHFPPLPMEGGAPSEDTEGGQGGEGLAYVLYTSGSTGTPKGVMIPHRGIVNRLQWMQEAYGLTAEDRVLQKTPFGFDVSVWEFFWPLLTGARLVFAQPEGHKDPRYLADLIAREKITTVHFVPSMLEVFLETPGLEALVSLRRVVASGEALPPQLVRRFFSRLPQAELHNLYGPTEASVDVSFWPCVPEPPGDVVPIGRPIANHQLHVVGRSRAPQPVRAPGELLLGGPGLARGYLGRPDLTAAVFIPDPFGEGPGGRLYRTGDLVRRLADGTVHYLGRIDHQVKIRGFRIELGEIEAALTRLPGVREAVVLVREDETGDKRLAAYVANTVTALEPAPVPAPGPEDLRTALRRTLPEAMIPAEITVLPSLPLNANGKVDRRRLSEITAKIAPERSAGKEYVAPRTPVEETLALLFAEVLGQERAGDRIGIHDHFFELGGHSLAANRLASRVSAALGIELPLRAIFEAPTVAELALRCAAPAGAETSIPLVARPRDPQGDPVSFSQLREWILDRLEPGNPAYNIPNNLRIGGPLSIPVLAEALRRLIQRHEVFRTAFVAGLDEEENEEPLQVVLPEVSLEVPVIDLSALPEALREAELPRQVRHHAGTGFDLTAPPLLRVRVIRLAAADHALLMTVHHIISDGWSMGILNQELAALYEAVAAGAESALSPLPVQYADYAVWQRRRLDTEALERQVGYWRRQLTGAPPLLELPTDRPRPPVRSSRGRRIPFLLPQPLAGRLEELALRHGATLFMVLLAGYQTLLARWSGQDDVVAGTYSGNRPRRELEPLIGFFIDTLVLRTDLSGDPSFSALLGRVRETTLGAYAHRDVPFEKLLEILQLPRDPSRTPLFQALLVLHNFPPALTRLSTGVRLASLPGAAEKSDYDLSLWLGETPQGIGGMLEYSTDLFNEPTMERFAGQLRALLEAAVADPDRNLWTLPLISEEEQARQLATWSQGPAVPEGPALLHRLVEEQALRTPTAVAVEAGDVRLTYADLVEQARRVAGGIDPGTIVALTAERTPELIVQMLAVLQAGAAYVPMDPAYPAERRAYMLEDSEAKDLKDIAGKSSFGSFESFRSFDFAPETPAYLIYTSGSTGLPKGVVVPHRAIASFVRAARETYEIAPGDRVLQLTSISFDTSAEEIWPALASGATLVLRPDDMMASIPHFLRELERLGITHVDLPTAFWHEMVAGMEAEDLELPRGLRLVILGGEEALTDRFALWHRRVGSSVRLVNTYGPTEATIVATRRELSGLAPGGTVPIGRPIPGARTYVLDRFFTPVPPGVRGELWIGGAGVARGYLGRPDLTAERFMPDPFSHPSEEPPGARLYRTGDLAVLTPEGDLIFAGRADRQLKIRGYRVEPGEIEASLRLHPALRDAVVDVRGPRGDQRLIAWIVPQVVLQGGIEAPGASDLRAFLRDRLPEPLLPAAFVPVTALPLTPSGKVDRRGLSQMGPEPAEARPEGATYVEPQSPLERTIAEIYRDLLRVGRMGLHDNFFDLGGHSLLIVRAHQKLREALGKEIPVLDLFRFPTVAALARHLGGEETGSLQKVQGLAEQQRVAQQRQKAAMERLRRPGRTKEQS